MSRALSAIAALALSASLFAQAPQVREDPTLMPRWNITTDFASPESAY